MQKNLASQGFTVIETLVVLSLIGIVAALTLPRLGGAVNQRDLEMVAQNLVSDIRLVQQLNINSGDLDANIATMYFVAERNGQRYYQIIAGNSEMKRVYFPKTVSWAILPQIIRFTITGAPATVLLNNSSQTITLKNTDGRQLYIKIAPVTGRVRVTNVISAGNE